MNPPRPSQGQIKRRRRIAIAAVGIVVIGAFAVLSATLFAPVDRHGARADSIALDSKAVDRGETVEVVVPGDVENDRRGLLIFLHGRNETAGDYLEDEAFFAALGHLGARAPVVAFPEGSADSYWHDRESGGWGTFVINDVIPAVTRQAGTDPGRVAIGGISMGGFGAYDLALHAPGRFCAVGGHSAALWLRGADTAAGAFDNAEDFARNDVIATVRANPGAFGPIPIWNDAGNEDPFLASNAELQALLNAGGANLTSHVWPGGHEAAYWDTHWGAYLRFYADALAQCG